MRRAVNGSPQPWSLDLMAYLLKVRLDMALEIASVVASFPKGVAAMPMNVNFAITITRSENG